MRQKRQQQHQLAAESTGTSSSDVQRASPALDDGEGQRDDTLESDTAAAAPTTTGRQSYVDMDTMRQM